MPEAALSVLYESTIKCGLLSASKHCLFCFPHMNKVELELYCSVGNLRSEKSQLKSWCHQANNGVQPLICS